MANDIILEVDLDGEMIQFRTLQEISDFLVEERSFWNDRSQLARDHFNQAGLPAWTAQMEYLTNLDNLFKAAKKGNATELRELKQAMQRMETNRRDRELCSRVSADAFIKPISERDPTAAVSALMLRRGHDATMAALQTSLAPLIRDAQMRYLIAFHDSVGKSYREKLKATFDAVEAKTRTDAAMDKFVGHWRSRSKWAFVGALVWLVLLAVLTFLLLSYAQPVLSELWAQLNVVTSEGVPAQEKLVRADAQALLAMAPIFVLIAIPAIWIFRHISRLFIDNLSDSRDASLRATMAETFVALTQNSTMAPSKEERAVILGALFRPGASQPPEEGIPLPIVEILKK